MSHSPIFIAGANRSGTTLLSRLLATHPHIALSDVEPNMWTRFYNQYGDLSQPANFERCLSAMLSFNGVLALGPDPDRIREEFSRGKKTYGRLFALFQEDYTERLGKKRWGDKTPKIECFAEAIFAAYPTAKMIHMVRDPRDRYTSSLGWGRLRNRPLRKLGRLGAGTARWLHSVSLAERNRKNYPRCYKIVRYETLVSRPEETLRELCTFLDEPYHPSILHTTENSAFWQKGGNSSFTEHQGISTASIGRFRRVMSRREIAFMQTHARQAMSNYEYDLEPIQLRLSDRVALYLLDWPFNRSRMVILHALEWLRIRYPTGRKQISNLLTRV